MSKTMNEPFFPPSGKKVVPLSDLQLDNEQTVIAEPTLLGRALRICIRKKRASISVLQKELEIGYEKAVAILDEMTEQGWIGKVAGDRPRPILNFGFETLALWNAQDSNKVAQFNSDTSERDPLFEEALRLCVEQKKASTSWLQRRLRIGYGRAAAILDSMKQQGFIGPADGSRPRVILPRGYELVSDWNNQIT